MAVATAMPTAVARAGRAAPGTAGRSPRCLVASVVGMVVGRRDDRPARRAGRRCWPGSARSLAGLLAAGLAPDMARVRGRPRAAGPRRRAAHRRDVRRRRRPVPGAAAADGVRRDLRGLGDPALVGPVVAGALAEGPGWRWVFLGLVPLVAAAVASLVPTLRRLRRPADPAPPRPRPAGGRGGDRARRGRGAVVAAGAGPGRGCRSLVGGLVLLALGLRALLPRGHGRAAPRGAGGGRLPRAAGRRVLSAWTSLVPLTLTLVHGYSPTAAGVPLTAGALGWAAAS